MIKASALLYAEEPIESFRHELSPLGTDLLMAATDGGGRLRELILTLAVRGKLVPQDPSDEPAELLIARIRAEMAELVADRMVRAERASGQIETGDCQFEIPAGWKWVRLAAILPFRIGRTPPTKDSRYWSPKGARWVSISDMTHRGLVSET